MYAPGMGRFITRDTWEGRSNKPMSFNKWNYVDNNPINRLDPSGHCYIDDQYEQCTPYDPQPWLPPNTKNYNEKLAPRNITWEPFLNPLSERVFLKSICG